MKTNLNPCIHVKNKGTEVAIIHWTDNKPQSGFNGDGQYINYSVSQFQHCLAHVSFGFLILYMEL